MKSRRRKLVWESEYPQHNCICALRHQHLAITSHMMLIVHAMNMKSPCPWRKSENFSSWPLLLLRVWDAKDNHVFQNFWWARTLTQNSSVSLILVNFYLTEYTMTKMKSIELTEFVSTVSSEAKQQMNTF